MRILMYLITVAVMGVASLRLSHTTYNYYVLQVTDLANPHDLAGYFGMEYLSTVADMSRFLLFRRLKTLDEHSGKNVMGEYRRLQMALNVVPGRKDPKLTKMARSVLGIEKQVPYAVTHYDVPDDNHLKRRSVLHEESITDPLFKDQWHLRNNIGKGGDMNVIPLWERGGYVSSCTNIPGYTGEGVTVAVADDGKLGTKMFLV